MPLASSPGVLATLSTPVMGKLSLSLRPAEVTHVIIFLAGETFVNTQSDHKSSQTHPGGGALGMAGVHLAVESSLCHIDVPLLCSDSSCGPGLSSCSSGPSRCGTWTLEHTGSVAMVLRLTCSVASGIPAP